MAQRRFRQLQVFVAIAFCPDPGFTTRYRYPVTLVNILLQG